VLGLADRPLMRPETGGEANIGSQMLGWSVSASVRFGLDFGDCAVARDGRNAPEIGIGGRLATPPLHTTGHTDPVPRRFDRVAHRFGEDRATRNRRCVGLVGRPDVRTSARALLVSQLRPLRQTLLRHDGVAQRSGFAWFAIAAKDTNAILDGSTLRGLVKRRRI
jgi:hypothetical protein